MVTNTILVLILIINATALIIFMRKIYQCIPKRGYDWAETDEAKYNIIHEISHEIRTPLNTIVGFSNIIASTSPDKDNLKKYSLYIEESTDVLLSNINNLLDYAMYMSSDTSTSCDEYIKLSSLCSECVKQLISSHHVNPNVNVSFHGNDENFMLRTNNEYLHNILANLLTNSAKYTSEGSIEIAYFVKKMDRQVIFTITDTGIGIDSDNENRIFDCFEQVNSFEQGMGLGLTICRELIHKLGGEINVDKNYREGARFVFTHPIS